MYSISAKPFLGSKVSGVVVVTLPAGYTEKQIADLYEKLWKLKSNRKSINEGHSTIDGKMVIINDTKIATSHFADMIDKHLGGAFEVTDTEAHTASDSKDTYDTNLQRPASKGSTVLGSERLDRFREQATNLIDTKISEAKSASGLLEQSELPAERGGVGGYQGRINSTLKGAPIVQGATGADSKLVGVAEQYAKDNGINFRRQAEFAIVDEERASRIADAYEAMPHDPQARLCCFL